MTSRREFVQGGDIRASAPAAFQRAVFDERFPAARAFAAEAQRRGWAVTAIRGDITELWRQELAKAWREGPVPVAGMTQDNALFCLERLAWDAGLRLTCRRREACDGLVSWMMLPPASRA
jgi:hypothetical protein